MENPKAGYIVNKVLRAILKSGKISKDEVDKIKTSSGTKEMFGFKKCLLSDRIQGDKGHNRYYTEPLEVYEEKLYLCSQWNENNKKKLIEWIEKWIDKNCK